VCGCSLSGKGDFVMMRKLGLGLVVSVVVVLGWGSGASAVPITAGLIAAYEFTGNADDVSGNGNNGVVNGATLTADRFGNLSSAYDFDGTSSTVTVPNFPFPGGDVSISFWFVPEEIAPPPGTSLLSINPGAQDEFNASFRNTGMYRTDRRSSVVLTTPLGDLSGWHQAVYVRDGTSEFLFYDGSLADSNVGVSPTAPFVDTFRFGGAAPDDFNGALDDIFIYDRALSPTEVSTLFSVVPEPSTAPLLSLGLVGMSASRRRSQS